MKFITAERTVVTLQAEMTMDELESIYACVIENRSSKALESKLLTLIEDVTREVRS